MSSVYFPAHVVVLFRRLVNVVSTLSISNHCTRKDGNFAAIPSDAPTANRFSYDQSRRSDSSEWARWPIGHLEGPDTTRKFVSDSGALMKAALSLPGWIPGWSSLFLSPETVSNGPSYNDAPPPTMPPTSAPEERPPHKVPPKVPEESDLPQDIIHQLLANPALVDPIRTPRYPIVLCHGLYGFDSRGPSTFPSMRMHYWSNVLNVLRGKVGAEVIVTSVPGTGSIYSRATKLDEQLQLRARGRGINFLAHSMGGLDCRHLISRIQPHEYAPLSLTSISTPHRGSPFMDWCKNNIGIGKLREQEKEIARQRADEDGQIDSSAPSPNSKSASETSFAQSLTSLPSSFTTLILSVVDSPAYANLTSNYLNDVFNPNTPDDPSVKYFSVAGRMSADSVSVWHPFWLPKMVLDGAEEKERERLKKLWENDNEGQQGNGETPFWADKRQWGNDGLVTVQSAKWGEFLGTMEGCDHWEMRGARGIEFGVDIPAIPAIGLGSLPLASSLSNLKRSVGGAPASASVQGDGWGFGDWTRFVGEWKKSKDHEVAAAKAGSVHKLHQHPPAEAAAHAASMTASPSAAALPQSTSPPSAFARADPALAQLDGPAPRTGGGPAAHDAAVKSSTDTLSVVFDWLIERVPSPAAILRRSTADKEASGERPAAPAPPRAPGDSARDLSAAAVAHAVGASASQGASADPSTPPSEMKRRMETEGRGRRKRELANKDDLERFYIALARKMYEAGL
ncbi:hypothetical protein HYPSUDRAFT_79384 [Hypholoma sublateritium FD-334 SS-4]|uniref:DUF676 domain-containing protein n=1 Tax=Hypholoma sublateritium (strain FD-334 SS-4) TaxID=945553 RepID=A0A0D2NMM9_HYPSF|nr:hypothetical protein HYPSUDRAFT_79384 [Hypholoma sublateritium FD-334 SS-4]